MAPKGERYYKNFYFAGNMSDSEIEMIDNIYKRQAMPQLKNLLNGITLHDYQTIAVAAMLINKRFFIGDGPGLGKTVEASAYLKLLQLKGQMKKFIVATTTDAVYQIKGEIEFYTGMKILPLTGDSKHVEKMLANYDFRDFDGIILQHSGLSKHNALGKFFSVYLDEFDTLILDESCAVKSADTTINKRTKLISERMNRVVFLNGTAFETHLFDFYYQFDALNPNLLPAVSNIKRDYCELGGGFWGKYYNPVTKKKEAKFKKAFQVVGYKNQNLLREKLKYHYLGREKKQVYSEVPDVSYILDTVDMSKDQRQHYNTMSYRELLNSPSTAGYPFEFTPNTVPKLARTIELCKEIVGKNKTLAKVEGVDHAKIGTGEQVVIYCWFIEAQEKLKEELEKAGLSCCIINGASSTRKQEIVDSNGETILDVESEVIRKDFNNKKYDILITNKQRALNIPSANYMIIYTIETNPSVMYQIMKRIDRNNFEDKKTYYFMLYNNSDEVRLLEEILADREFQANMFTGATNDVFRSLTAQLNSIKNTDDLDK